jgi:hypothetical protein
MNETTVETTAYRNARRHVERKLGFMTHLAVYVIVNGGLMTFNLTQQPRVLWAVWPILGWGIGLLFHGLAVYLHNPGATWKQRMIDNELKKRPGTPT